jgi:hypothetical protein
MFGGPACAFFKRLSNRIHYHILFSVRDDHDKGKDIEVMSLTTIVVAANALMLARSLWTLGIIARQGKAFCGQVAYRYIRLALRTLARAFLS